MDLTLGISYKYYRFGKYLPRDHHKRLEGITSAPIQTLIAQSITSASGQDQASCMVDEIKPPVLVGILLDLTTL